MTYRRSWGSMLRTARAAVTILAGGALGVALPPQMRDMLAASDGPASWGAVSFQLALLFFAGSAWFWARAALAARFGVEDGSPVPKAPDPATNWRAFEWLPRLMLTASFMTGAAVALRSASYVAVCGAVCLGGLALLLTARRRSWLGASARAVPPRPSGARLLSRLPDLLRHAPFGPGTALALLGAGCLILGLGLAETFTAALHLPRVFAAALPGPAVALTLLGLMIGPLTALTYVIDDIDLRRCFGGLAPRRPPMMIALVVYIFIVVPETLDVHTVRLLPPSASSQEGLGKMKLADVFEDWVGRCQPGSGPIRPVIVAVSGGATRAALWGAAVIDQVLQADQRSGAALFAISSVSGGSLGAAAALSLVAQEPLPCRAPDLSRLRPSGGRAPLAGDAIGPLLAGWLVDDIPRAAFEPLAYALRALTGGGGGGADSAAALETAFEDLWSRVDGQPDRSWDRGFLSLFYNDDGAYKAGMPLWFANGTDAGDGNRIITSPISPSGDDRSPPGGQSAASGQKDCVVAAGKDASNKTGCHPAEPSPTWPFRGARDFHALMKADVAISTAIDNTSRFPFLEPYGQMLPYGARDDLLCHVIRSRTCPVVGSLIDGGYFENEGLQTALDLAEFLVRERRSDHRGVEPIIVEATGDGEAVPAEQVMTCDHPTDDPSSPDTAHGPWQVFAPLFGLYHVRGGHSAVLLRQAYDELCPSGRFAHFYLRAVGKHEVPLNWVMSYSLAEGIWKAASMDDPFSMEEIGRLRTAPDAEADSKREASDHR